MSKKILMTSLMSILFISNIAHAQGTPYLGAQIGASTGTWQIIDSFKDTTNFRPRGTSGGVFGGYGATIFPNFYMGGELLYNSGVSTTTQLIEDGLTSAKIHSSYTVGASFIPGLVLSRCIMVYGRGGIVGTRFKVTQPNFAASQHTATGVQFGLGVQAGLLKKVDMRVEYSYMGYHGYSVHGNSVSPQTNLFTFALVYKFGDDPRYNCAPNFWNCSDRKWLATMDCPEREYCANLNKMKIN